MRYPILTMQNFDKVRSEITANNVLNVYSVAYTLQIPKLVRELEAYIVGDGKFLQSDNCQLYLIESLKVIYLKQSKTALQFESKLLRDKATELLLANFQSVVRDGLKLAESAADGKGDNHLVSLPVEALIDLLRDDRLNVDEEILIVDLITSYIKYREAIKPLLDEEDPANDEQVLRQLNEEEKKAREEARAAKAEEEKKAKE